MNGVFTIFAVAYAVVAKTVVKFWPVLTTIVLASGVTLLAETSDQPLSPAAWKELVTHFGVLSVLVWYIVYSETRIRPAMRKEYWDQLTLERVRNDAAMQLMRDSLERNSEVTEQLVRAVDQLQHVTSQHQERSMRGLQRGTRRSYPNQPQAESELPPPPPPG